jgi:transcriptional regulator with XRE-family HTH domain
MNLLELSQRIKQRRQELGLTLDESARAAGQTRSWLSKVENFRITPSLPALARMAKVLRVPLAKLLEGLDAKPSIVVTRVEDRRLVKRDSDKSNIRYLGLTVGRPSRSMDPFLLEIPARGGRSVSRSHEGEEFLIVLRGEVTFEYDGENYDLREGDSLYFDAKAPHRVHNPHGRKAHVLCVFQESTD